MSRSPRERRGGPIGKRRRAREIAVQMLYQQEQGGAPVEQIFDAYDASSYLLDESGPEDAEMPAERSPERLEESIVYARELVDGTLAHREDVDALIRRHAENWRIERMPVIDRNILRLAVYEMLHQENVPKVVIVDEAIELAKKFGSESSGRFVNGLLDGIMTAQGLKAEAGP